MKTRTRRYTMVTLTKTASQKVQEFIQEHGVQSDTGLRVAVLPGGCSGFQYGLNIEDGPEDDDEILDVEGIRVFVHRDRLRDELHGTGIFLPQPERLGRMRVR